MKPKISISVPKIRQKLIYLNILHHIPTV